MAYFGSVRFFKNLIFAVYIATIALSVVLCVQANTELAAARQEVEELTRQVQSYQERAQAFSPLSTVVAKDDDPSVPYADGTEQTVEGSESDATFEAPAYQELFPDFYAPQEVTADQQTDKTAYLTFDDGPSSCTDRILDILADHGITATFYVVANDDEVTAQRLQRIVDEGHTLGMHSGSHQYRSIYSSVEAFLEDMYQVFCLIRDVTGVAPTTFRCPGGSINTYNYGIYQEILAEMLRRGFVPCDWNLSAEDAITDKISSGEIVHNIVDDAPNFNRAFILMHDSEAKTSTVNALDEVITQLTEQGFTFQSVTPEVKPMLFGYDD